MRSVLPSAYKAKGGSEEKEINLSPTACVCQQGPLLFGLFVESEVAMLPLANVHRDFMMAFL